VKGKVLEQRVPEDKFVEALLDEARKMASESETTS
jgi:hypothetical protein